MTMPRDQIIRHLRRLISDGHRLLNYAPGTWSPERERAIRLSIARATQELREMEGSES